jgi:hypothetical protein
MTSVSFQRRASILTARRKRQGLLVDFYHTLGYLTGLLLIKPDIEPNTLLHTAALVHILDAILCRVIAAHSGRRKNFWMTAGLLFGIWALGTLFLLPAKKCRTHPGPASGVSHP